MNNSRGLGFGQVGRYIYQRVEVTLDPKFSTAYAMTGGRTLSGFKSSGVCFIVRELVLSTPRAQCRLPLSGGAVIVISQLHCRQQHASSSAAPRASGTNHVFY